MGGGGASVGSIGQLVGGDGAAYRNAVFGGLTPEASPLPKPGGLAEGHQTLLAAAHPQHGIQGAGNANSPIGSEISMAGMAGPGAESASGVDKDEVQQGRAEVDFGRPLMVPCAQRDRGVGAAPGGGGGGAGTMTPHSPPQRDSPSSFALPKKLKMTLPGFR